MSARIAFLGTPDVAVPALEALVAAPDLDVVVVVTNPDRPRGRSGTPVPPPVKVAAERHGIRVLQPQRPAEVVTDLEALDLAAAAVVAYGAILPPSVLATTGSGFVNLHFSLLPRWRGAAPVQHALRAGDEVTGVTCFVLDEGMDTGPVVSRIEVPVGPDETAGSLLERLASVGAPELVDAVRAVIDGAELTPQPHEGVTYAPKITREDVRIDFARPARAVHDLVRSANPAPGALTSFRGGDLKVWRTAVTEGEGEPGTVLDRADDGPVVACGEGAVRLLEVQPAGKPRIDGGSFVNGYQPEVGAPLAGTT